MADAKVRSTTGPHYLRVESGQLLTAESVASRIENMFPTEEGTLRSVWGPTPYLHDTTVTPPVPYVYSGASSTRLHGIGHAVVNNGTREILLAHWGDELVKFEGWNRAWTVLVRRSVGQFRAQMEDDSRARAPSQFVATPNGVIILPQDSTPLFYDGECVATLGYNSIPGPPSPAGVDSSAKAEDTGSSPVTGINDQGFVYDAQQLTQSGVWELTGQGRVGTVERFPGVVAAFVDPSGDDRTPTQADSFNSTSGQILEGEYVCAVQWVDRWGNLSPLSTSSAPLRYRQQRSRVYDPSAPAGEEWVPGPIGDVLKFIYWSGIPIGPTNTIGRILYRSRDLKHSGTTELFELPANAGPVGSAFATVPDNIINFYPDNTPDSWLSRTPVRPIPVEKIFCGTIAFGRFWSANWDSDPGKLHPSLPGRWGTFVAEDALYPDPGGTGITGLIRHPAGLLCFTLSGTYLVKPADDGSGRFIIQGISDTVGCAARASVAMLTDNRVIWLARDGFYQFDGKSISRISASIGPLFRRLNIGRIVQACAAADPQTGEYRCWVPLDGSRTNNICLVFDGAGWRQRSDITAVDVAVTNDHRSYMLVAGTASGGPPGGVAADYPGVWCLDNEVYSFAPAARAAVIETAWMGANRNATRTSPLTINLWLRETDIGNLTIKVYRDWRDAPEVETQSDFALYPTDDEPFFWGTAEFGTDTTFYRKRPYWRRADIAVPSCEVYKIVLSATVPFEFLGISIGENVKDPGGSRTPP
jgi:hypothetical protein